MKQITFILFLFALVSCVKEKEDRSSLIKNELNKKIETYKDKRYQHCKNALLDDINIEVDSIMYFLVEKMQGKSEEMPARPDRPGRLVDTIALENKPK